MVWPSTCFTDTVTGARSLCWRVTVCRVELRYSAAPPKPQPVPMMAQASTMAITFAAVLLKKLCFFRGRSSGETLLPEG